ncbi:MAG: tetratricopeptide repeat protein [Acidobacteria bacterium]|nr:tetratricopeptide repeat protein [Acidobacteriota bacterium]
MKKLSLLLLVALFAFPLFAAEAADPVLDQARGLISSGQAAKAVDVMEKAVAAKPNDARRQFLLGVAYGASGREAGMFKAMSIIGKARDAFEKAVQLDPNYLEPRFALLEFYGMAPGVMGGDDDKAKEQAVEIRKRDASLGHKAFALIAESKKDMKAARAEYDAAVKEAPNATKPRYWLGVYLMTTEKNYAASAEQFNAALNIDPNYGPAQFQIGHLAAMTGGNLARGEELLKKYIGTNVESENLPIYRAHYWLGLVYEKQGKKPEARAQLQQSLRLRPDNKDTQEALKRVS